MKKILKASAGTGKTYRLALEYVISLINGEPQNDIIVMTFTRKATSEIKKRIVDFLKSLCIMDEEGINIKKSIENLYPKINIDEVNMKKIYENIVLNKDNLKVYTIDGFKNIIFKNSVSKMLNINTFEIIEDFENYEILKKCFEKITSSEKNFKLFQKFFETNLERNVEKHIDTLGGIINHRWKYIILEKREREPYDVSQEMTQIDEMLSVLEKIREYKKKESTPIVEHVKKLYKEYLGLDTYLEKEKFLLNNWKTILDDKYILDGRKIRAGKDEYVLELFQDQMEIMDELKSEISKRIYNDKVISYEREMLSFLDYIYGIYDEIKFKEHKFTHSDITNYTLKYIGNNELNLLDEKNKITTYMKEILESEATTIFIDEFQDTSVVQWKILSPFVESAKNVICVGDEKQSIYGWRDGDKNLFMKLPNIIDCEVESLDTCYRSEKRIVDFTNSFFENYSKSLGDISWEFNRVNGNKSESKGFVGLYSKGDSKDDEFSYKEIIKLLKENYNGQYKGIGILARSNKILNKMAFALSENKIPYFLETRLSIFESRVVSPILTLFKYFITENNFYLIEFLRDDLIFIGDDSLKKILLNLDNLDNFNFENPDEKKVYEKIIKYKNMYRENNFKLYTVIEEIIKDFGVLDKYTSESDIKNVYKFLEKCKEFEFIEELIEEVKENNDSSQYRQESTKEYNGVALMTIHKSKGLEFDTVFYIHNSGNNSGNKGFQFNIKINDNYKKVDDYLITESSYEKIFTYLEDQFDYASDKKRKEAEEEINNIYVALTRPKKNLFIVIDKVSKNGDFQKLVGANYFNSQLVYTLGEVYLKERTKEEEKIEDMKKSKENEKLNIDFRELSYDSEKLEENINKLTNERENFTIEREEKKILGTVVHYFFENIKYAREDEIILAREKTISKYGALYEENFLEKLFSRKFIERNIRDKEDIFSESWDFVYNEYPIYSEEDKSLYRIDRLMIKKPSLEEKGKVFIVDYKTGGHEEEQIENYEKLVSQSLEKLGVLDSYNIEKIYLEINMENN